MFEKVKCSIELLPGVRNGIEKKKILVLRGVGDDRLPLTIWNVKIDCVRNYLYLGA